MTKLTREEANKLLIKLSWKILEAKFAYYHPELCKVRPIADDKYDKMEDTYKKLCKLLKVNPTACNSVGFPTERACARLIMSKLSK